MNEYKLLSGIHSPDDVKKLNKEQLSALCAEIRSFLIEKVTKNGGHLASNLGVVELSVALHRVFDCPKDRMIFDVGHQAYVHKILTGRADRFDDLRIPGGLSGFTRREESASDAFGAGHSGTALSAAVGFAEADKMNGSDAVSIAIIGDGAFGGGMVQEALAHCSPDLRLIAILNENEMSIGKNTGALANYLAKIRSRPSYFRFKRRTAGFLRHLPLIGKPIYKLLLAIKIGMKNLFYGTNFYEDLGFTYMGPVDGHDIEALEAALLEAKKKQSSVLLHIKTVKGKGMPEAEENPLAYHSVYPKKSTSPRFPEHFGATLMEQAMEDEKVVAVTAAMTEGTGLGAFSARFPHRFFDVGIAEEHAVTFAAGLAAGGMKPYVAIYSTFLQRSYDQIIHDVALQNLPVRFCIDRAGLAPSDGATHHGIFDVSYLSHIPNMTLYAPATFGSMTEMMKTMQSAATPCAIRYANAAEDADIVSAFYPKGDFGAFGVRANREDSALCDVSIVTYGQIAKQALLAQKMLEDEGISTSVILLEVLKPYEETAKHLLPLLSQNGTVLFMEEGIYSGGASMHLTDLLAKQNPTFAQRCETLAIFDHFAIPTSPCDIYTHCAISAADAVQKIKNHRKNQKNT